MGLDALIRSSISFASSVFTPVKTAVYHDAWTGQDGLGAPMIDRKRVYPVLSLKRMQHRMLNGQVVEIRAMLTFLDPIAPQGTAGRQEPVDPRDRFVLPDGSGGPIVDIIGPYDQGAAQPFYVKVFLGVGR